MASSKTGHQSRRRPVLSSSSSPSSSTISPVHHSSLLPSHCHRWIQCSGHPGVFSPSDRNSILKKVSSKDESHEVNSYLKMSNDEYAKSLIPTFHSRVIINGEEFIEMEDLLCRFERKPKDLLTNEEPWVMDIKMGTRTFLEKEISSSNTRNDLYEKMIKIDAGAVTQEEREKKSITKLRYMTFRESLSSSLQLGFRIEGVKPAHLNDAIGKEFQLIREASDIEKVLTVFLDKKESLRQAMLRRLKEIRSNFVKSPFFATHEVIGSSLLVIHDRHSLGVWMIDFAKTVPLPEDVRIDHIRPWTYGNHEDGYLYGLNNLICLLESMSSNCYRHKHSRYSRINLINSLCLKSNAISSAGHKKL